MLESIYICRYHLSSEKQQSSGRGSPSIAAAVAAYATSTAPSPPLRENMPRSFVHLPSAASTITSNGGGSDPNLSHVYPAYMFSMRRQLLRRVWSKECRRYDRT